jgi:SAM-dependent methyltransferase
VATSDTPREGGGSRGQTTRRIDQSKVRGLFDRRAGLYGKVPLENITMFQEKLGDLAQRRDRIEREKLTAELEPYLTADWRVCDVACGTGRWTFHLAPRVAQVDGFDVSEGLVEICRSEAAAQGVDNVRFEVGSLTEFPFSTIYDLVLIAGVCVYSNDDEWATIAANLRGVTKPGSLIVVQEPVGSAGRYEVISVWSEELQSEYSAIYRDVDFFLGAFGTFCRTITHDRLFEPSEEKWLETHYHYFVFEVP